MVKKVGMRRETEISYARRQALGIFRKETGNIWKYQ